MCAALVGLSIVIAVSPARGALPTGYLDSASCDSIAGWAQDPDEPDKPIAVHISFTGPGGSWMEGFGARSRPGHL